MNRESERQRLVGLIRSGIDKHESTIENYVFPIWKFLADYLLDNGVIVPPVKVGTTVYVISRYYGGEWRIFECKVYDITIFESNMFIAMYGVNNFCFSENIEQIGKAVFISREEAEKALEKLKGGAE